MFMVCFFTATLGVWKIFIAIKNKTFIVRGETQVIALSPESIPRESTRGNREGGQCHFPWRHFPWVMDVSAIPGIVTRKGSSSLRPSSWGGNVFMSSVATPVSVKTPLIIFCWLGFMCLGNPWKVFWFSLGFFPGQIHKSSCLSSKMFSKDRLNENIFFRLFVTFLDLLCIQPASSLLASLASDKWLYHYLSVNNIPLCFSVNRIMPYLMRREMLNEDTGPTLRV